MGTLRVAIVRHGKAHADSPTGLDRDRDLHPRGERQARWLGEQLAKCVPPPALVVASPFVRTHHTAQLIISGLLLPLPQGEGRGEGPPRLHPTPTLEFDPRLEVGFDASDAVAVIEDRAARWNRGTSLTPAPFLVIVGHNPQAELLVGALVEGISASRIRFRTGECYVLEMASDPPIAGTARIVDRLRLDEDE